MAAMDQAGEALATVAPALAFLLVGVPLAALLDELGFFDSVAGLLEHRYPDLPVLALWLLAAATTIVLNLDTTIVLLTPLYVRLAGLVHCRHGARRRARSIPEQAGGRMPGVGQAVPVSVMMVPAALVFS